ncbi:MAG TPA: hypothetical protein VFA10_00220 [Ktedonobacteraceae bacterium]|nr:hypothetical protein [Ktedonobacteraceae bacterium]
MSSSVQPLESLFDQANGQALPLPTELLTLYGPLQFPLHPGKAYLNTYLSIEREVTYGDATATRLRQHCSGLRESDGWLRPPGSVIHPCQPGAVTH